MKKAIIESSIFASIILSSFLSATTVSVYWEGRVLSVSEFSESAAPIEIVPEARISGRLAYDPGKYANVRWITGTNTSGTRNIYESHLNQSFNMGQLEWNMEGGVISLTRNFNHLQASLNRKAFDAYSTSDNSSASSFPGLVGPYEFGFALFDSVEPFLLFDTYDIAEATLDVNRTSSASGFFTTRLWDNSGNIVDGYYVTFSIDTVSAYPVTAPPRGLFGPLLQVAPNRYRSVIYGELEFANGGNSQSQAFGHSLQAPLRVQNGTIHSPLYGNLTPNPWNIDHWVVSQFFGLVHFARDAAQYAGWVWSQRFGWMRFNQSGNQNFLWANDLQTWMSVNPDGSFTSFDFGRLTPLSGFNRYHSNLIGNFTTGDFGGWVASDRFGFTWAARNTNGVWFYSQTLDDWMGVTAPGMIWSTKEGRFLE